MVKSEQRGIQSIDVGGRLLTTLMAKTKPMMLKELSADSGVASAQAHAYLSSFKRLDLVVQDTADGRYSLGPLALRLGLSYMASFAPLRDARNLVAKIENETGFMTILAVWSNGAPTVIEVRPGNESLNVNVRPGSVFPVTGSSVGFVFAAHLSKEEIAARKEAELAGTQIRGGHWHLRPKEFAAHVADVKACGFATLAGQPIVGINSLSVPVFTKEREFIAAIMLLGHEEQMDVKCEGDLISLIKKLAPAKTGSAKRG